MDDCAYACTPPSSSLKLTRCIVQARAFGWPCVCTPWLASRVQPCKTLTPWHPCMAEALAPIHGRGPGTHTWQRPWHPCMAEALATVYGRGPGTRIWQRPWHPYMAEALAPIYGRGPGTHIWQRPCKVLKQRGFPATDGQRAQHLVRTLPASLPGAAGPPKLPADPACGSGPSCGRASQLASPPRDASTQQGCPSSTPHLRSI